MNEAQQAIKDIEKEFKAYGNTINIQTEAQDIAPTDPAYDWNSPENNKGTPTLSTDIYAFVKDLPLNTQKALSESLGKNIVGKRVKQFKFYTDIAFNKVDNQIVYKSDKYEIVYIAEKRIQDTTFLYEIVGVN